MTDTPLLSRRALFVGAPPLRPPWALEEEDFRDVCTRCNACVARCPEHVLVAAASRYPIFDPQQGECTFCGDCVAACEAGALNMLPAKQPWSYRAMVTNTCLVEQGVVCGSCKEACPESAIDFSISALATPRVRTDSCTGCGACVGVCPVGAIALTSPERREIACG